MALAIQGQEGEAEDNIKMNENDEWSADSTGDFREQHKMIPLEIRSSKSM